MTAATQTAATLNGTLATTRWLVALLEKRLPYASEDESIALRLELAGIHAEGREDEAAALDELFAGPTAQERASGLRFVGSDATGFDQLRIEDGTAHVTLVGGCSSGGSTFTVADELAATLRQFTTVDAVKIYDPDGQTAAPDEPGDSIPACLEP